MMPELGHFALTLALCMALVQGVLPLASTFSRNANWIATARAAAYGQFVFVAVTNSVSMASKPHSARTIAQNAAPSVSRTGYSEILLDSDP